MSAFERRTPHYLRIYRDLRGKIQLGALAPSERLPTQRALAERYGVTLMTVRQALQLLEQEELVVMRQGLGTFVAPKRLSYAMGNLRSLAQEVAAQQLQLQTRVLSQQFCEPHPQVAELLRIEGDDPVFLIERLRFVGLQPFAYQRSHLQPWLGEALDGVDLTGRSLYDYLHDELGIEIAHAQEWTHAINLPPQEATLLEEQPGAAALFSERLTFAAGDEPILLDRAYMPGDRISMSTDRFFADVTVGYQLNVREEAQ